METKINMDSTEIFLKVNNFFQIAQINVKKAAFYV